MSAVCICVVLWATESVNKPQPHNKNERNSCTLPFLTSNTPTAAIAASVPPMCRRARHVAQRQRRGALRHAASRLGSQNALRLVWVLQALQLLQEGGNGLRGLVAALQEVDGGARGEVVDDHKVGSNNDDRARLALHAVHKHRALPPALFDKVHRLWNVGQDVELCVVIQLQHLGLPRRLGCGAC